VAGAGAFVGFRGQQDATRQAVLAQMSADKARSAEKEALEARDQVLRTQSLSLSFLSQQAAERGETEAATLLALEALPASTSAAERPYVVEAEAALYQALLKNHQAGVFDHAAAVTYAAFNRAGDRIVTASYDKAARIWDIRDGTQTATLSGHQGVVETVEFSADGSRVLTTARDGTARIWDAISGKQFFALPVGRNWPTAIFSPSGNRVLTAAENSEASLWDARTGEKVLSVRSGGSGLACFSPDGSSFATSQGGASAASDQAVLIWDAEDGRLKHVLKIRTYPYSVAFSPDGGRLLI